MLPYLYSNNLHLNAADTRLDKGATSTQHESPKALYLTVPLNFCPFLSSKLEMPHASTFTHDYGVAAFATVSSLISPPHGGPNHRTTRESSNWVCTTRGHSWALTKSTLMIEHSPILVSFHWSTSSNNLSSLCLCHHPLPSSKSVKNGQRNETSRQPSF